MPEVLTLSRFARFKTISIDQLFPWLALWLSLLSYGLMVPWLGIYADEWTFYYAARVGGLAGAIESMAWDRPLYAVLLGSAAVLFSHANALAFFALLLLRWADALLLAWFLKTLFPEERLLAYLAGLVWVIFPAFKQMLLPVEYFGHFITLGLLLVSFTAMVKAIRQPQHFWRWSIIAWAAALNLFIIEYFFGQEFLRPLIIWAALGAPAAGSSGLTGVRHKLKRLLGLWLPYLLVTPAYLLFKGLVLRFTRYPPVLLNELQANPRGALFTLAQRIVHDFINVANGTWVQIFQLPEGGKTQLLYVLIVLAAVLPCLFFVFRSPQLPSAAGGLRWYLLAGAWSVLVSGIPFWISGLPIELNFAWDRPTLSYILGVSILTAGLLGLLRWKAELAVLFAVLVGLSVGLHYQNANSFRKEVPVFQQFFWQLAWRAPLLQPQTALVLDVTPFNYTVDTFLSIPLNLVYADNPDFTLSYKVLDFNKLYEKKVFPAWPGTHLDWGQGPVKFHGTTDNLLMATYNPSACLRLLGPEDGPQFPDNPPFAAALAWSKPSLVGDGAAKTDRLLEYIGAEPPHTWCYYFEKAELARQLGDWDEVIRLGETALAAGYAPAHPLEQLTFIEAYARRGNLEKAAALSQALTADKALCPAVCALWKRLGEPAPVPECP